MKKSILAAILAAAPSISCAIHIGSSAPLATPSNTETQTTQQSLTTKPLAPLPPQTQPTTTSTSTISDAQILAKAKEILAASKTMNRDDLATCGKTMRHLKEELQPIREAAEASAPGSVTRTYLTPVTIDLGLAITCDKELASNAIQQVEGALKELHQKTKS